MSPRSDCLSSTDLAGISRLLEAEQQHQQQQQQERQERRQGRRRGWQDMVPPISHLQSPHGSVTSGIHIALRKYPQSLRPPVLRLADKTVFRSFLRQNLTNFTHICCECMSVQTSQWRLRLTSFVVKLSCFIDAIASSSDGRRGGSIGEGSR